MAPPDNLVIKVARLDISAIVVTAGRKIEIPVCMEIKVPSTNIISCSLSGMASPVIAFILMKFMDKPIEGITSVVLFLYMPFSTYECTSHMNIPVFVCYRQQRPRT